MSVDIAYLSQGKLYLKLGPSAAREIESPFGQSVQERRQQLQRKRAWREQGMRAMMMPPEVVKQLEQHAESTVPVSVVSVCSGPNGKLLYALEVGELGGLFMFDAESDREERMFHNTEFHIGFLDFDGKHNSIACAKTYPTGVSSIATLNPDSVRPQDITEGDSIDLAPCWVPGSNKALVYQSAGVMRNGEGFIVDRTPFTIEKLDFDKQEVATVGLAPGADLLGPKMSVDGYLYYIRRPHRPARQGFGIKQTLKELLLIPLRLAYAVFQFFNTFTQMFTGKPLITAGSQQKVEPQRLRTLGGWFTPQNLPKKHTGDADAPSLVPPSWELVRQDAQGFTSVVAESVLAFDVGSDGTIAYTNGSGIYIIHPDSTTERLLVGRAIEAVTVLQTA